MLAAQGIISASDHASIQRGMAQITSEIESGAFEWKLDLEDVHLNIEARLTQLVGDAGKRLHTGRSRNDQVATDVRLWLRGEIDLIGDLLKELQVSLVDVAEQNVEVILPGFTHLQVAQPVSFGHHMLAYVEMFKRDAERMADVRRRTNVLPLGSAALAGTTYPLDRERVAKTLGMEGVCQNSLDAVSDRDFAIEFTAAAGLCHSDLHFIDGLYPTPLPAVLGHEAAGIVEAVGEDVTYVKPGDHVIPLYTPECRQCKFCLSRKTNLCQAIRSTQGKGLMPDGSSRFSIGGKPVLHYMGTSTFANHIVVPGIALAKIRPDAPFDKVCYIGCGVTTGIGAVIFTAKVEAGANVVVFGLGGIGLNVIQGAKMVGADKIIGVDLNPEREAMARKFGMTHFINPKNVENVVDAIVQLTDGGADYSFECIGNTKVMRDALECTHKGWGRSIIIGVAEAGALVEHALARIARGLVAAGTQRLVVAGGETSGAVLEALRVRSLDISPYRGPGTARAVSSGKDPISFPLKPGKLGAIDMFERVAAGESDQA